MVCRLCTLTFLMILTVSPGLQGAAQVDFQRDVLPILREHCHLCHGVDAKQRQGGLRLDQRETALKGGDSETAAIVPGSQNCRSSTTELKNKPARWRRRRPTCPSEIRHDVASGFSHRG